MSSVVSINGKKYTAPDGCSVSVINNKVYFDGKLAEDFNDWKEKNIEIKIQGNCHDVKTGAGNITVEGNVEGDASTNAGNIKVRGDIRGNASTDAGNISSHHIFGNANTDCGNIRGTQNVNSINIGNGSWFNNIIEKIFD